MNKNTSQTNKLKKHEWRAIEQPTFKIRMRIICNLIKMELNKDGVVDVKTPQTEFVTLHPNSPITEPVTWENWWFARVVPKSTSIQKIQESFPGTKLAAEVDIWLNGREVGSPLQRHLFSIDARCLELLKDENADYTTERFNRARTTVKSVNRVWRIFSDDTYFVESDSTNFSLLFQSGLSEICLDEQSYANQSERQHIVCGILNPYVYSLPREIQSKLDINNPYSILEFLFRYAAHTRLINDNIRYVWVFDVASVCTALIVESYANGVLRPELIQAHQPGLFEA